MPDWTCPSGYTCHLEYCLTQSPPDDNGLLQGCAWQHPLPTAFTLQSGGIVYGSYRVVYNGTATPSTAASASIIWNTDGPTITVNSPVGLTLNTAAANGATTQLQLIDVSYGQWVTYIAVDLADENLTGTASGCAPQSDTCVLLTPNSIPIPTTGAQEWEWPASAVGDYGWLLMTAMDQAGNLYSQVPSNTDAFTEFTAGNLGAVTCEPLSQNTTGYTPCTELADVMEGYEIPGDPPSVAAGNGDLFQGYADPSMRWDPLVTTNNPYGTNLWMLYSFPLYNTSTLYGQTVYSPAVETHLDQCSVINYTIITSSILYFHRNTTGAALTSSKY